MNDVAELDPRQKAERIAALFRERRQTDILPAEDTVRIMLADLDDLNEMTPDEANDPINAARRDVLLTSFRILRTFIG